MLIMTFIQRILIFIIIIFYLMFLSSPVIAAGSLELGEPCLYSRECGRYMGCRTSELRDYKVCKIAVPNALGCDAGLGENMCADEMLCLKNRCKLAFGLNDASQQEESAQLVILSETDDQNEFFNWGLISLHGWDSVWQFTRKGINVMLAIALLFGATLVVRGWLMHHSALGFIPLERKGWYLIGTGSVFLAVAISVWYLIS